MRAMQRKAPVLAWILTGLTCFLIGALVGTGWNQAAALPVFPTVGVVVTVEVAFWSADAPQPAATATPEPGSESRSPIPGEGLPRPEP